MRKKITAWLMIFCLFCSSLPQTALFVQAAEETIDSTIHESEGVSPAAATSPILDEETLEVPVEEQNSDVIQTEDSQKDTLNAEKDILNPEGDTENWMETMEFGGNSANARDAYQLEPAFSSDIHDYVLYVPDYRSGLYCLSTSLLNSSDRVQAVYTDKSGNSTSINAAQYQQYQSRAYLADALTYGPEGNIIYFRRSGSTAEYTVTLVRTLSLKTLEARYDSQTFSLYDETKLGTLSEERQNRDFDVYVPVDSVGKSMTFQADSYYYTYETTQRREYQVTIGEQEVENNQPYRHKLSGQEEELALTLSYEGAQTATYTIHIHPVNNSCSMLFSTDTPEAAESLKVQLFDQNGIEIKGDAENPLLFPGLLQGSSYSYTATADHFAKITGTFTAGADLTETVITFSESTLGLYLEYLKIYGNSSGSQPPYELTRQNNLDEIYGGMVYTVDYSNVSSYRSFYVACRLSSAAPADATITISAIDLAGVSRTSTINSSTDKAEYRKQINWEVFQNGELGYQRGIYSITVGNETDNEQYTVLVNRPLQLSNLTCQQEEEGDSILNEQRFQASVHEYTATVSADTTAIYVSASTYRNISYNMKINGEAYQPGEKISIPITRDKTVLTFTMEQEGTYPNTPYDGIPYTSVGTYTLTVTRAVSSDVTFDTEPADTIVALYDKLGNRVYPQERGGHTYVSLNGGEPYTYVASLHGYLTQRDTFTAEPDLHIPLELQKTDTTHTEIDNNEWWNFRNNEENNGITEVSTPDKTDETTQKWAVKIGNGWQESCTPPIILGGHLYVGIGKFIYRLEKETGEVLAVSEELAGSLVFALNPLTYAEGMIYAQIGNGQIQAVDATTLKSVWISEAVGGQTLSPITYKDGYIYTGTWNSELTPGSYFCISVTDEDPTTGTETKYCTWKYSHNGGFYWAGAYATNDFVVFGADDGSVEGDYTDSSTLYSLSARGGEILDKIDGLEGDIRSTIVYDNGYVYFTTKGGILYQVRLKTDGTFGELFSYDLGGMSTASPVVYKGRVYVGVCGTGGQFTENAGHHFAVLTSDENGLDLAYTIPTRGYPQAGALLSNAYEQTDFNGDNVADGRVYLYFTYNTPPGGIYYFTDEPGQTSAQVEDLFTPEKDQQQYCISTICVDSDGTLYYKNDSGYLIAVASNGAYLEDLRATASSGEITWDVDFAPSKSKYSLLVDTDVSYVDLQLTIPEGRTVTIDDKMCTDNYRVQLDAYGEATVVIRVEYEKKARTYTLQIAGLGNDASLGEMYVSANNSYSNLTDRIPLSPGFDSQTTEYITQVYEGEKQFLNLYARTSGSHATMQAEALEGVKKIDRYSNTAGTGDMTRFAVYFEEGVSTASVRITVTSGDGRKSQSYQVDLLRKDVYPPKLTDATVYRSSEETATISFTSNETGYYYYQLVPQGDTVPRIDTSGSGLELHKGENRIALGDLEGSGWDLYLTAVDMQQNQLTEYLKFSLPYYRELLVTVKATPSQTKILVENLLGDAIPEEGGYYTLVEGNAYKITLICAGYDTREEIITASADKLAYTYTLVSNRSNDATLKMLRVSSSDTYGQGLLKLSPGFSSSTTSYKATYEKERSYLNIWPEASSTKADVKVYAVGGVKDENVDTANGTVLSRETEGHTYYAVYFEEQIFSATVRVEVTAEDGTKTNYFLNLQITDTTAPVLKKVSASRISDTEASVSFKSSEKGECYYKIVKKGAKKPTLDTRGTGDTVEARVNSLSLTNLSTGAKDLYLVVKDSVGNVSEMLKIPIPASKSSGGTNTGNGGGSNGGSTRNELQKAATTSGDNGLQKATAGLKNASARVESKATKKKSILEDAKKKQQKEGDNATASQEVEDDKNMEGGGTVTETRAASLFSWENFLKQPWWVKVAMGTGMAGILYLFFWLRADYYQKRQRVHKLRTGTTAKGGRK